MMTGNVEDRPKPCQPFSLQEGTPPDMSNFRHFPSFHEIDVETNT